MAAALPLDERVLILAPSQIAAHASHLLTGAGFACLCTSDAARLGTWLAEGVGMVIAAANTLPGPQSVLQSFIDQQPAWSDLPIVLLTGPATDPPEPTLGHLQLISKPFELSQLQARVTQMLDKQTCG